MRPLRGSAPDRHALDPRVEPTKAGLDELEVRSAGSGRRLGGASRAGARSVDRARQTLN